MQKHTHTHKLDVSPLKQSEEQECGYVLVCNLFETPSWQSMHILFASPAGLPHTSSMYVSRFHHQMSPASSIVCGWASLLSVFPRHHLSRLQTTLPTLSWYLATHRDKQGQHSRNQDQNHDSKDNQTGTETSLLCKGFQAMTKVISCRSCPSLSTGPRPDHTCIIGDRPESIQVHHAVDKMAPQSVLCMSDCVPQQESLLLI